MTWNYSDLIRLGRRSFSVLIVATILLYGVAIRRKKSDVQKHTDDDADETANHPCQPDRSRTRCVCLTDRPRRVSQFYQHRPVHVAVDLLIIEDLITLRTLFHFSLLPQKAQRKSATKST